MKLVKLIIDETGKFYAIYDENLPGFIYDIDYHLITADNIFDWIHHLCEKTWITTDHIIQLLDLLQMEEIIKIKHKLY